MKHWIDMNAKEAKGLTDKSQKHELEYSRVIKAIKKAASNGEYSVTLNNAIHSVNKQKLQDDGFDVIGGYDPREQESYTLIRW